METDYKYKYSKSRSENGIDYTIYAISSEMKLEKISSIRAIERGNEYLILEEKGDERFLHGQFGSKIFDSKIENLIKLTCIEDFMEKLVNEHKEKNASRS